jgi:ABC-type transport system involved in cytochrome c biogenesis permease subunit
MLRIYILGRPPVGTLYESVLFVSLICPFLGTIITIARKDALAIAVGAGAAASLLLISPVALPQGDSLEVLVAVLNTNFWLATHVICITAGYGVSILTACLAHALLALKSVSDRLRQNLYQLSLSALFLMVVGTVLGGIWADQSWGRFWGWDPKENGALLICLWLLWIQHGRLSLHLDQAAFMAMLAALNIIVAISWFGVNLLSVGLHSYGFTSGMASGLALFCTAEFVIIAVLWIRKARLHEN